MKVEVKEGEKEKYPYIGESDGVVVLFTGVKTGIILVVGATIWNIGHYDTDWDERDFTPFTGSVTLSN